MTDTLLQTANQLKHEISGIEAQIQIISDMEQDHASVKLYCSNLGSVVLDEETRDTVCGIVLNHLTAKKGELEDRFRML